jgi:ribosomal-protein-serine acetyltransferase
MFSFEIDHEIDLRLLEERHAPELFALTDENRKHLARWLAWVDATRDVSDTLAFIRNVRKGYAANRKIPTGIWYRGALVGCLELFDLDPRVGSGEVGYWLAAPHQRKGIVSRACQGLITHAFTRLDLNRIVLRCHPKNDRSSAIARRLGFTFEGRLRECARLRDELVDLEVYSVLRREWDSAGP